VSNGNEVLDNTVRRTHSHHILPSANKLLLLGIQCNQGGKTITVLRTTHGGVPSCGSHGCGSVDSNRIGPSTPTELVLIHIDPELTQELVHLSRTTTGHMNTMGTLGKEGASGPLIDTIQRIRSSTKEASAEVVGTVLHGYSERYALLTDGNDTTTTADRNNTWRTRHPATKKSKILEGWMGIITAQASPTDLLYTHKCLSYNLPRVVGSINLQSPGTLDNRSTALSLTTHLHVISSSTPLYRRRGFPFPPLPFPTPIPPQMTHFEGCPKQETRTWRRSAQIAFLTCAIDFLSVFTSEKGYFLWLAPWDHGFRPIITRHVSHGKMISDENPENLKKLYTCTRVHVYKSGWAPPVRARPYCPTTSVGKAGPATQEEPQVRDTSRSSVAKPTRRPGGWSEEIENQPCPPAVGGVS